MIEYTNTEITRIINEYIHNERNRHLLLRRYVDGLTLESLAEEFDLSVRQVKNIIYKNEDIFLFLTSIVCVCQKKVVLL